MNPWSLVYDKFEPEHEPLHEALCTLGNGYFATRGAAEESQADEIHYPGTYLAGGYNRLKSMVAGRELTNEDLVNFPNWLVLNFRPDDKNANWLNLLAVEIRSYRQELDMQEGVLKRTLRFCDHQGRETTVTSRRIVHMGNRHLAAIEYSITPENWSGPIRVKSALDGSVINAGVARYRELNSKHLETLGMGEVDKETIYLHTHTNQSRIEVAMVARTQAFIENQHIDTTVQTLQEPELISQELSFDIKQGQTVTIEKVVSLYTSKDRAVSECLLSAKMVMEQAGNFSELLGPHINAWKFLWHRCDVEIDSKSNEQQVLRLHIFHLLQSVSMHSTDLDVGVPARGLHGEAYRGHIFWDELFIFPFYTYRIPEITRSLLLYRYRRLNMARSLARAEGYQGAMYPWQSGSDGQEETQVVHLNPRSNTWGADYSHNQRHVNLAIIYNVWQYYLLSNDVTFLATYGAEMVLEIVRFWVSITEFNDETQKYEIKGVMGPDEYHEKYPGTDEPGLKNNAYTNVMVVWSLERALEILDQLVPDRREELIKHLDIKDDELKLWKKITKKMTVAFHDDHIISQFQGYEHLEDFDWEGYEKTYGNIERLDRILKAEGDSPDRYKVSKQADVLMLFYLLPEKELKRIIVQLGYKFDSDMFRRNVEYYEKRTSHGSTLSKVVHASVMDAVDRDNARDMFQQALDNDISDVQGGTTPEGIHLGAMAGTVDIVLRHYAGINTINSIITFNPCLPEDVSGLRFRLKHHNQWYRIDINQERFKLSLEEDRAHPHTVEIMGKRMRLEPGTTLNIPLKDTDSGKLRVVN